MYQSGPSQENGKHIMYFKQRTFTTENWLHKYWKAEKVKTLRKLINSSYRKMLPLPGLRLQKVGLSEPSILEKGPVELLLRPWGRSGEGAPPYPTHAAAATSEGV